MRQKGLLYACFFGLVVICCMSFPSPSESGPVMNGVFDKAKDALSGVLGAVDQKGDLISAIICRDCRNPNQTDYTDNNFYPLVVVAPGKLISQGFSDVKRGDVIYLQILDYEKGTFQICTEREECATFGLDDKGRMFRIDVTGTK